MADGDLTVVPEDARMMETLDNMMTFVRGGGELREFIRLNQIEDPDPVTGYPELHKAAGDRDADKVVTLLGEGASLEVYSDNGLLPLHCVFLGTGKHNRRSRGGHRNAPDPAQPVLEVMLEYGADLNAATSDGRIITDLPEFWYCHHLHDWITEQDILLPDFTALVANGKRLGNQLAQLLRGQNLEDMYELVCEYMEVYLRAGSRDELAVQSVAAIAMLHSDGAASTLPGYLTALAASPSTVRGMDFSFMHGAGFWRYDKDALPQEVFLYVWREYRCCTEDQEPYYRQEEDIHPGHLYWRHASPSPPGLASPSPPGLAFLCICAVRAALGNHRPGRSILPAIHTLPVPPRIHKLLRLDMTPVLDQQVEVV